MFLSSAFLCGLFLILLYGYVLQKVKIEKITVRLLILFSSAIWYWDVFSLSISAVLAYSVLTAGIIIIILEIKTLVSKKGF